MNAARSPVAAIDHADDLLDDYTAFIETLDLGPDARHMRWRLARSFLAAHGSLESWMTKPITARRTDLRRIHAWPFVSEPD